MTCTSSMSGMLRSTTGSRVRRVAAMQGRAAFLLPEARTLPRMGCPPSISYLYMMRSSVAGREGTGWFHRPDPRPDYPHRPGRREAFAALPKTSGGWEGGKGEAPLAKVYFRYAAMNAGKSTQLLQVRHNYHERHQRTLLLKPHVDNRGGRGPHRAAHREHLGQGGRPGLPRHGP